MKQVSAGFASGPARRPALLLSLSIIGLGMKSGNKRHGKIGNSCPKALAFSLALVFLLASYPQNVLAQDQPDPLQAPHGPPYQEQSPQELQQLVAPFALYPDSLVAQILAASTFPEQVVDADRWLQSHPDFKGDALAQAVDRQPWDPSIKALVAFPSVLGNMDKNLSWTSSLGDAYYNQEQGVMDAVQLMRRRAQAAGNLNSTSQQIVTTEGSDIEIEPVSPWFADIDTHEVEDDFGRWSRFPAAPENQDGVQGTEIASVREVIDPSQAREVFVEMVKQARQE